MSVRLSRLAQSFVRRWSVSVAFPRASRAVAPAASARAAASVALALASSARLAAWVAAAVASETLRAAASVAARVSPSSFWSPSTRAFSSPSDLSTRPTSLPTLSWLLATSSWTNFFVAHPVTIRAPPRRPPITFLHAMVAPPRLSGVSPIAPRQPRGRAQVYPSLPGPRLPANTPGPAGNPTRPGPGAPGGSTSTAETAPRATARSTPRGARPGSRRAARIRRRRSGGRPRVFLRLPRLGATSRTLLASSSYIVVAARARRGRFPEARSSSHASARGVPGLAARRGPGGLRIRVQNPGRRAGRDARLACVADRVLVRRVGSVSSTSAVEPRA